VFAIKFVFAQFFAAFIDYVGSDL